MGAIATMGGAITTTSHGDHQITDRNVPSTYNFTLHKGL